MKKRIQFSCLLLLWMSASAFSQSYTFKVLANKGHNQVRRASGELVPMKTGDRLYMGDVMITASDAYIGLMHYTGRTTEVRGPVTATMEDLEIALETRNMTKYNRPRTAPEEFHPPKEFHPIIAVLLPSKSLEVFGNEAILRWKPLEEPSENTEYIITIKDIFDDLLFSERTSSHTFTIHFDEIENESGLYIFTVQDSKKRAIVSHDYGIKKLYAYDRTDVADGLSTLRARKGDDPVEERLLLADFYEKHDLLLDASTQYEKAIEIALDNDDIRSRYDDFLIAHNFVKAGN